ncbi:hypothetical protein [Paraburkholderia sp. GAS334]|jgi:hypothetical protein|uniref:hypothetical protein n=1 Tax=unclassified Paraburkholderia TaxID=2615204 RepID=UPI003D1B68EC
MGSITTSHIGDARGDPDARACREGNHERRLPSTIRNMSASTEPYGVLIADIEVPVSGIRGAVPIIHNSAQAFLDARDGRRQSLRSCILRNVGIHFFQPV